MQACCIKKFNKLGRWKYKGNYITSSAFVEAHVTKIYERIEKKKIRSFLMHIVNSIYESTKVWYLTQKFVCVCSPRLVMSKRIIGAPIKMMKWMELEVIDMLILPLSKIRWKIPFIYRGIVHHNYVTWCTMTLFMIRMDYKQFFF